jgi:hypothetical protein
MPAAEASAAPPAAAAIPVTTMAAAQPVAPTKPKRPAWVWGVIAGSVVAVGAAVGLGLGLGLSGGGDPAASFGKAMVH